MTTIAYRDGVLASDTLASCSGIADCEIVKIVRNERGNLIGSTGEGRLMFGVPVWAIKWGAVALLIGGVWFHGRSAGKDAVLDRLKDDRIQILKDGKEIDRDVDLSDDGGLCGLLGGCRARDGAGGD